MIPAINIIKAIDFSAIRSVLAKFPSDHDAAGSQRPTVDEIFAPEQHANALDPHTSIVVGARGMGKSFWAGVLEQDDTRQVAAQAYPKLGLERLLVRAGYNNSLAADDGITARMIEARVPVGDEAGLAFDFWQSVILRAAQSALEPEKALPTMKQTMQKYADPEDAAQEWKRIDLALKKNDNEVLVTFDALDTISRDWKRSALLLDALFEVIWSLRARHAIRAKVFIRPEQLNDKALRFIELPKLRSSAVELSWTQTELYGLLFWRLAKSSGVGKKQFLSLSEQLGARIPANLNRDRHRWALVSDAAVQKKAMTLLAGPFMGRTKKAGGTYDWPFKHLADAMGQVTPRSFIKLLVEAAKAMPVPSNQAISAEGIRDGLRAASKVRVDQLATEYPWVKRALLPLVGLRVPCVPNELHDRWRESKTIEALLTQATDAVAGYLPPFPPQSKANRLQLLTTAMADIGVLAWRADERIDMPDLFRIAAKMLKKGGTSPNKAKSG
jgi:hypothetical protein